jgi:hypothetical protein
MTKTAIAIIAAFILGMIAGATAFGSTPAWACSVAAQDLALLPPEVQRHARYLYFPAPTDKTRVATLFTVNTALSHASRTLGEGAGVWFARGGALVRLDLAIVGGDNAHVEQLISVWESLRRVEPYFHANAVIPNPEHKPAPENGKPDTRSEVEKSPVLLKIIPAPYLPAADIKSLEVGTHSLIPIVRGDWLIEKAMSQINGGRYYEFRGLRAATSGSATHDDQLTQSKYLELRGLDTKAIEANQDVDRAVVAPREPTGSPGAIILAWSTKPSPGRGPGLAAITHDQFEEDRTNAEFNPERNLLGAKFRGAEIIVTLPSGWHEYSLWDAQGKLVDEAPPNLAADRTVPRPGLPRLQPAISCIRCHGQADGWLPIEDRVRARLAKGEDILGDFSRRHVNDPGTLNLLAGLYTSDIDEGLRLGRNAYHDAVLLGVGAVGESGRTVSVASAWLADVLGTYVYSEVTAEVAAQELGLETLEGLPRANPEDVALLGLFDQFPIPRREFEQIYVEAAVRASASWITNAAE